MSSSAKQPPYLSVVVTSRNDNHGGDLVQRMQTFLDALATLCAKHRLTTEVIFVEWNPPADRPRLAEALRWPDTGGYCQYRIVEVPPELHATLPVSDQLPLFQMIAKNVGIRRARGQYILATNVDLIFSEQIVSWLAQRSLKPGVSYRIDRYDVPLDVMRIADLDWQLDYCRQNLLRVHVAQGTVNGKDWERFKKWKHVSSLAATAILRWPDIRYRLAVVSKPFREWWRHELQGMHKFVQRAGPGVASKAVMVGWALPWLAVSLLSRGVRGLAKAGGPPGRAGMARFVRGMGRGARWGGRVAKNLLLGGKRLHTNACGDFTLMAREDWMRLGGYAEFPMYSWHIDSLFLHAADAAGIKEAVVPYPVYHIEHGGGWSPESCELLFGRLRERGIPFLTNEDLDRLSKQFHALEGSYRITGMHWGFALEELPDVPVEPTRSGAATHSQPSSAAA